MISTGAMYAHGYVQQERLKKENMKRMGIDKEKEEKGSKSRVHPTGSGTPANSSAVDRRGGNQDEKA